MSDCVTPGQLRRYSKRYGMEATLCNDGSAVELGGDAFDCNLLELGMADRRAFEFVKETLIKKHCSPDMVRLMERLKAALP